MSPLVDPLALTPLALTQALIRCASVTPADNGAIDVLSERLSALGFTCHDLTFSQEGTPDIRNLYARLGDEGPNLCFAGHTDVVPVGQGWTVEPFAGEVIGDHVYGRGAADMKGAIACFVAAVARYLEQNGRPKGSISLLITGDEEGPAVNGTVKVLDWIDRQGERIDACIVGEPTNPGKLGEMMKIGRRGSLNARLTVFGSQGHVAYPHLADNPIPRLMKMLAALTGEPLDEGNKHFQPSTLVPTTVDVGNPSTNVIPAQAKAGFNIRFNDEHTGESLSRWIRRKLDGVGGDYELAISVSGESFLTPPGPLVDLVARAVTAETGLSPDLSTTGGTSDARFIKNYCPVVEFGLVNRTMHKADERVALADLEGLTEIYRRIIDGFFSGA